MNIKSGDIIQSNRWPEPVEIELVEEMEEVEGYVRLVGYRHQLPFLDLKRFSERTSVLPRVE